MMSSMDELDPKAKQWLSKVLDVPFKASKHIHSHQDEVYKIETSLSTYYLKISKSLKAEHDNLKKLATILNVPKVINFHEVQGENDYLLISELPGKNLVELIGEWSNLNIVDKFAEAIRQLHAVDVIKIFPKASSKDVLLHGDMALPNIIISEQGRIGYIDFGQISFGSPELDLADAIWSLQRNIGPDYGERFLKQYGPVAITARLEKALEFKYQPPESR
jgi:aminoglycoside phosphotransferase